MNTPIRLEDLHIGISKKHYFKYSKERSRNIEVFDQNYPNIEDTLFSQWYDKFSVVMYISAYDHKNLFRELLYFRKNWNIIPNMGRMLVEQREKYRRIFASSYAWLIKDFILIEEPYNSNHLLPTVTDSDIESKYFFRPSKKLAELVFYRMNKPNNQMIESLNKMCEDLAQSGIREITIDDVSENISNHIEGILATIAGRMIYGKEVVEISEDNRLTSEICSMITDRLELDAYDPRPVHDHIYSELVEFALKAKRKRQWGELFYDTSTHTLKLQINPENITFPDINLIDDDAWIVT